MTNRLQLRTATRCKKLVVLCLAICSMELGLSWSALGAEDSGAAQPIAAQPKFTVHDLGALNGSTSFPPGTVAGLYAAVGINNFGQVIGNFVTDSLRVHAFRTAPNSPVNTATDDLGILDSANPYSFSEAIGINNLGQVAGMSNFRAFRTAPNAAINPATDDLGGCLVFSYATAINDHGQVTGFCKIGGTSLAVEAWRTDPNGNQIFIALCAQAHGINISGQVVGEGFCAPPWTGSPNLVDHAFRTSSNAALNPDTDDLGTLGGSFSSADSINNSGQVVGSSQTASGQVHTFRTAPNAAINPTTDDLGTLGGDSSSATGINSSGQVIGYSEIAGGQMTHPFLYSGGVMSDMNNLIPSNSGWTLYQATAINDLGQIVAYGLIDGGGHAIRLDPTPAGYLSLLQDSIESFDLSPGISKGLNSILLAAMDALQRGNITVAENQRRAFENAVNALRDVQLTDAQADTLLNLASLAI